MRFLLLALLAAAGLELTGPVADPLTPLAAQPSFGPGWFLWPSYLRGQEWVFARQRVSGGFGRRMQLSPGPGVYCQPRLVPAAAGGAWAFWTRQSQGRWQIVGRRWHAGRWDPLEVLSDPAAGALSPAALAHDGGILLAWEDHRKAQRIAVSRWGGGGWARAQLLSPEDAWAYRPVLAAANGEAWLFWDAYLENEKRYAVFGRRLSPAPGPAERVSPPGTDCLKPAALYASGAGLAVAWVSTRDVRGGAGILDHWDEIRAAVRAPDGWKPLGAAAPLQHGLLVELEPKFVPVWGYSGRRRHPMWARDGSSLWLVWERRINAGGRSDEPGQLCGRKLDAGGWAAPVVLHEGLVEYALSEEPAAANGSLTIAGRDSGHAWHVLDVPLDSRRALETREWTGWTPADLPAAPPPPRRSIEIAGRRHFLYWGDLHVHSALTPDAEGEPDELLHFARDRAQLDAVVIQENDSNSWMKNAFLDHRLTESEYALSVYLSRRYTEPGRFVALPGWEWSHRTPDDNKPNHRTVLFAGEDTPILRHTENGGNFDELCDAVEAAGGVMFAQHEAFRLVKRSCDAALETATGWSNYIDPPDKIHADLSAGFKVGFVATSDGHRRNPGTGGGLTGIYSPELTPRAILDAVKQRRVYATSGARVFLDARANGKFMGEDVEADGPVRLTLEAAAPRTIMRAVLLSDGREIHSGAGQGRREMKVEFTDNPAPGFHWYYWRIELDNPAPPYPGNSEVAEGHLAWSSPHRVQAR